MNTIKKITYGLLFFSLVLASCADKLNINPENDISADQALETAHDVNNALVGAYTIIARGSLYGTNLIMIPDLLASSGYVNWTGSFTTYRDIAQQDIIATNEDATRTWMDAYQAINAANVVMGALNVLSNEDEKKIIEGKALFIRGLMHFELVRLYALPYDAAGNNSQLGVPIMLEGNKNYDEAKSKVARNSVAEVYQRVETDLKDAISRLQQSSEDYYAAKAMLCRVYLQEGKFEQARTEAHDIISNGGFSLSSSIAGPFRTGGAKENVFEIKQTEQSNAGTVNDGLATFYSSFLSSTGGLVGRADLNIVKSFADSYLPNDKRRTELIYDGTGIKAGLFSKKWLNYFDNLPVIRLAELHLIRAECNLRLNSAVGETALKDVNLIRRRAGIPDLQQLSLQDILSEREKELAFEGVRLHDLKRTKRNMGSLPYNADKLVFPIPYREVSVNANLKQNPGYQ